MDGKRFDTLIQRLAHQRVTRLQALHGLAAGAVAVLTGVSLTADEAGAAKDKERKRHWCHRGNNFTILGKTKKLTKEERKRHRRKGHKADYRGRCTAERSGLTSGGAATGGGTTGGGGTGGGGTGGGGTAGPGCLSQGPQACAPDNVCCPQGTCKVGRCVGNLNACGCD